METILGTIPRAADFKIIGFFNIGMYEYDSSFNFFSNYFDAKFLNLNKNIDFLEIYMENFSQIESAKKPNKRSST